VRLSANGGTPTGLVLENGKAQNVAVTAPDGLSDGVGVRLAGGNTQFGKGSVDVPGLRGIETSGTALVLGSSIRADVALMATSGAVGIAHANIETSRIGILSAARFRLSEPARVTIRLSRASRPRLGRSIRVNNRRGANAVRLRRRLVRALGPGRYRIKVSARDAAGNLAKPRIARLRGI